ncbi:Na+/H+ antiporter subunit B [soil metagenome]
MRSLILRKVATSILPVTTLFAFYLLLRGHNHPGGGFIAGLVTSAAVILQGLSFGASWAQSRLDHVLRPAPWVGLAIAIAAGAIPLSQGDGFLTHYHAYVEIPNRDPVHLSTTLLFDVGVYLVVVGIAATLLRVFSEEEGQ